MWTFLNVVSTLAWELVSAASPHDSSCFDQDLFYSMSLHVIVHSIKNRTSANSNCNSKENMFLFIVKCKASSV